MAKKKHKRRSHQRKSATTKPAVQPSRHTDDGQVQQAASQQNVEAASPVVAAGKSAATVANPYWTYVRGDIRRIGILVIIFVLLQFGLLYLLNHTGLGPQVYQIVKTT
jgi:outer membrane biosynthesis protein TonB